MMSAKLNITELAQSKKKTITGIKLQ